ncbi:ATP-binding protein [Malonomonas rubra]|uniref:ATP-binding protein n=1 Tax=Malonomonas rubra TaxID=57040 RepID=UPI0026F07BA9|nr:ATP-binding protein [Malonomonas rubra]
MSIKLKLVAILGLVSLVLGGALWLELTSAYRIEQQVKLFVPATGYLLGIAEVNTGIARQTKEALDYLVTGEAEDKEDFKRLAEEVEKGFELWIKSAETQKHLGVEGGEENIDKGNSVKDTYYQWVGNVLGSFDLIDNGQLALALKQFEEGSWKFLEKKIFSAIGDEMQDGFKEVESAYHELLLVIGGRLWGHADNTEMLENTHAAINNVVAGCQVNSAVGRQFSALSTYLLTSNPDCLDLYRRVKVEAEKAINDWFYAAYEQSLIVGHQYSKSVSNVSKVVASLEAFFSLEETAVNLKQVGEGHRALRMIIDGPMESPLGDHLPLMMFSAQDAASKELVELADNASQRGVVLIVMAFLFALVMILRMGHYLLMSLHVLQEGMDALASGQLDKRIELCGKDELAQLAEHFNSMSENLYRSNKEIEELNVCLERRVAERTKELAKANHELEAFNSAVSHDLRSPLSVVTGYSEVLLEQTEESDELGRELLLAIHTAGEKMDRIISSLLELSRIDTLELDRIKINLSKLVTELMERFKWQDPERRVRVIVEPNLIVIADYDLLLIVLENLLGNAWKYTSAKQVAEIELGSEYAEGRRSYFIRDNGAGFDMNHVEELFKPFKRLHSQEKFEGIGVGLATVQRILQSHGGEIWAKGAIDRGATFYFTLS